MPEEGYIERGSRPTLSLCGQSFDVQYSVNTFRMESMGSLYSRDNTQMSPLSSARLYLINRMAIVEPASWPRLAPVPFSLDFHE